MSVSSQIVSVVSVPPRINMPLMPILAITVAVHQRPVVFRVIVEAEVHVTASLPPDRSGDQSGAAPQSGTRSAVSELQSMLMIGPGC